MMSDIFCGDIASLPPELTAANFGKVKNDASDCDVAAALFNLVYQTVGVLAIFALTNDTARDIVLTGSLACLPPAVKVFGVFEQMKELYGVHFIIPPNAAFATAIGAVMMYYCSTAPSALSALCSDFLPGLLSGPEKSSETASRKVPRKIQISPILNTTFLSQPN